MPREVSINGKHYIEEQFIGILKAHEAGAKVAGLVRKHGICGQGFCRLKSKFVGMEVNDAKLKMLLAEAVLDMAMPKAVLPKKW